LNSLQGIFGYFFMSILLIAMYFIPVPGRFGQNPRFVMEDALDGLFQLKSNPILGTAFVATFTSISIYYYVALSITKVTNLRNL